jgi:glutamine---fructose-6-phosphate transaminase (isomerizing)
MEPTFPGPEEPSPPYGRTAHPYFLHEMIRSQPAAVRATARACAEEARSIPPPPVGRPVLFVGIGTSYHAALAAAWAADETAGDRWPARAVDAYDLFLEPALLRRAGAAVVFSASGETAVTIEAQRALRAARVPQILISGTEKSRSAELADHRLLTREATERAWVHTVSYTTAIAAALALRDAWSGASGVDWGAVGGGLDAVVGREAAWRSLATAVADRPKLLVLGSGPAHATAREAALKLREGAARFVASAGIEEFLHGILPSVDATVAVLAITGGTWERSRAETALSAAARAGAKTALLCRGPGGAGNGVGSVPDVGPSAASLVDIVPFQFLAYWLAVGAGRNPDVMGYDDPRILGARRSYGI